MTIAVVSAQGSIGQRHARILQELGCDVTVATSRPAEAAFRAAPDLPSALDLAQKESCGAVGYVVIASPTSRHMSDLTLIMDHAPSAAVMIEKPIAANLDQIRATLPGPVLERLSGRAWVGYNWRWHPGLHELRERIATETTLRARLTCASFLPDWRPSRDYRTTSSARSALGGGVLRDLSHEMDMAQYLFGPWLRTTALGGKLSGLEIDAEDGVEVLSRHARCPMASLSLSYFDRTPQRRIEVTTDDAVYALDLLTGGLSHNGTAESFGGVDVDEMMRRQHRAAIERSGDTRLCPLADAIDVQALITAAEASLYTPRWTERSNIA